MINAFREGLGRVRRAPALVAGVWLATLLLAIGPALTLHALIEGHLGSSMMADTAATGVNFDWWNEFLAQASGIGQSFVPAILGFAAVLEDRKSTRLNSSHLGISYAVFCLKKKKRTI